MDEDDSEQDGQDLTKPHREDLCSRCKQLGRRCTVEEDDELVDGIDGLSLNQNDSDQYDSDQYYQSSDEYDQTSDEYDQASYDYDQIDSDESQSDYDPYGPYYDSDQDLYYDSDQYENSFADQYWLYK